MNDFGSSARLYVWRPLPALAVVCSAVGSALPSFAAEEDSAAWKPHNVVYSAEVGKKGELPRVQVVIDGRRHSAIVDSGAAKSIVASQFADSKQIVGWSEYVLSHGGLIRCPTQRVSQFKLGGLNCEWITEIAVADLEPLRQQTGVEIEAIVGMDILQRFVSHFDFDKGKFFLCSKGPNPVPPGEPVPLLLKHDLTPCIIGNVGHDKPICFMLDTGACGGVLLTAEDFDSAKESTTYRATGVRGTSAGLDGVVTASEQLRLSHFALNDFVHSGLVAEVSGSNKIGRAVLCRYRVTIDPFSKQVYLAPSRRHLLRDDSDYCGLSSVANSGERTRRVTYVAQGSIAQRSGFRSGDVITGMDEMDEPVSSNCDWNRNLTYPKDRDIRCFVRRGTAELTLVLPSGKPQVAGNLIGGYPPTAPRR